MLWKPLLSFVGIAAFFATSVVAYYDDYEYEARDYYEEESLTAREDLAIRVLSELATRRYGVDLETMFTRAPNDDPDNKFDLEVTPKTLPKQTFRSKNRRKSNSGFGLWKTTKNGEKMWKVFKTESRGRRVETYYKTASAARIPTGNWKYEDATIKFIGKKPDTTIKGGVLVVDNYGHGTQFEAANFEKKLQESKFPKDKNSKDYKRLVRALEAAKKAGLQKPQGYLNPGGLNTIIFTNIVTTGEGGSQDAAQMLEKLNKYVGGGSTSTSTSTSTSAAAKKTP